MATLPHTHTPHVHQLQREGADHARSANAATGHALRASLEGRHADAAVHRVLARCHRDRLRVVSRAQHEVAIAAWAGFLADPVPA